MRLYLFASVPLKSNSLCPWEEHILFLPLAFILRRLGGPNFGPPHLYRIIGGAPPAILATTSHLSCHALSMKPILLLFSLVLLYESGIAAILPLVLLYEATFALCVLPIFL